MACALARGQIWETIIHPAAARSKMDRSRLEFLLKAAAHLRVAVVGDAMLDVYLHGDVDRISPEAPVPVVSVERKGTKLGGAANVSLNLHSLGGSVHTVSVVGDDTAGKTLRSLLKEKGLPEKAAPLHCVSGL